MTQQNENTSHYNWWQMWHELEGCSLWNTTPRRFFWSATDRIKCHEIFKATAPLAVVNNQNNNVVSFLWASVSRESTLMLLFSDVVRDHRCGLTHTGPNPSGCFHSLVKAGVIYKQRRVWILLNIKCWVWHHCISGIKIMQVFSRIFVKCLYAIRNIKKTFFEC